MKIKVSQICIALVTFLVLILFQSITLNQTYAGPCDSPIDPQADTDNDGYLNTAECPGQSGITMPEGMTLLMSNDSSTSIKPCSGGEQGIARMKCVDALTQDLFAIISPRESNSKFPSIDNPVEDDLKKFFDEILQPVAGNGLGVTVHPVKSVNTSRDITASQKAITITEGADLLEDGDELGTTALLGGTPNDLDSATVYTFKIVEYMCGICGRDSNFDPNAGTCSASTWGTLNCADSSEATGDALVENFVRHVNSHEIGHTVKLANSGNPMDEYHYPPEDQVIMSTTTTFTKKGKKVTFYLPDNFTEGSTATLK